jgi:hypothetical protein
MITKLELLQLAIKISQVAGVKMAVGGGVAVNAYGYKRETSDVDAFFHFGDRKQVLRAVNVLLGDDFILEELDPAHWIVVGVGSPPDVRIDLLFATGDPEESAIEMAVPKQFRGVEVLVFPVDLLVISKFLAERDDAKDALDIYSLLRRGAASVELVVLRLKQMGQDEDAVRFASFVEYLQALPSKKRKNGST